MPPTTSASPSRLCQFHQNGETLTCEQCGITLPALPAGRTYASACPGRKDPKPIGVGSILSGMLGKLGIQSSPSCKCKKRALQMDALGPDWCEKNLDVVVGWLRQEATIRKLPFLSAVARGMVRIAIWRARKRMPRTTPEQT